MDSGLTVKPAKSLAQAGGTRSSSSARSAATTELAAAQIVTASEKAASVDNAASHGPPAPAVHVPYEVLDEQSQDVGPGERKHARQNPDILARRVQAYSRPAKKQADPDDPHADIEV
jgi:hypothetical protein